MASVRGRFEYSDGLTPGKSDDGSLHHNLYDSEGRLVGHAKFVPDDEDESSSTGSYDNDYQDYGTAYRKEDEEPIDPERLLAAIITMLEVSVTVARAANRAAPHVKKWWDDQAAPSIRTQWSRLAKFRRSDDSCSAVEEPVETETAAEGPSRDAVAVIEEQRVRMSSAEARARLLLALAAKAFSDEQMKMIYHAQVEDDEGLAELHRAIDQITPEQASTIVGRLEGNSSFLDVETSVALGRILRGDEPTKEEVQLPEPGRHARQQ
jgi:hypothetical protein